MAHLLLAEGWRLSEDGERQWILQRENPKAKDERHRWEAVSFRGTREGLIEVALPHRRVRPTDATCRLLKSPPPHYVPGALARLAMPLAAE